MQRWTVHFTGHVQGVGFRYTTVRIARRFAVCGFVRNLDDGCVQLVAEGDEKSLHDFVTTIQEQMRDYIHDTRKTISPATGEFAGSGLVIGH